MNLLARVLGSLEARLNQPWLSIWRTLYFNFRTMPFKVAIKLPVFIYGRVRFFMLNGSVIFEKTKIKRGMVKIGINGDSFTLFDHSGYVSLGKSSARIVFEGPVRSALNAKIRVPDGELRLGKFVRIGSDTKVICNGGIVYIGDFTGITFGCTIMNSSFHYTYDLNKHCYKERTNPIYIGAYNWIGNQTTILGKSKTKDYTIIGTGSLINRDYSNEEGCYPLLAGRPAKIVGCGIKRVFSPYVEEQVQYLFNNKNSVFYVAHEEIQDIPENIQIEM